MHASCILLNGDYSFLCLVSWKRAMKLLYAEKAKVLKYSESAVNTIDRTFKAPSVMALMKVVRVVYRGKVPFSKKNVLIRDRFVCNYCGERQKVLTLDHIIPRSRGGKTGFDNCVACCKRCNHKKGSKTPREAGMHLRRRPYQPTISEFVRLRLKQSGVYDLLVDLGIY